MTGAERNKEVAYWLWVASKWSGRGQRLYADMAKAKANHVRMGQNNGWEAGCGVFNRHQWRTECLESQP